MSTHTVALDAEAFAALKAQKRAGESFSMVIKRLTKPWRPISEAAGGWSDLTPEEQQEMDDIYRRVATADRRRDDTIRALWG